MRDWQPTIFKHKDDLNFTIEYRFTNEHGEDMFALCHLGYVYNDQGEWVDEPMPSSRTDEFKKSTRFPFDACVSLYETFIEGLKDEKANP